MYIVSNQIKIKNQMKRKKNIFNNNNNNNNDQGKNLISDNSDKKE